MESNGAVKCDPPLDTNDIPRNKLKRRYSQCNGSADCIAAADDGVCTAIYDGQPAAKYREVDTDDVFELLDFPDEVLLEIFKNLDTLTQHALRSCCKRFHTLLLDCRFWQHIDLSERPMPYEVLEDVLECTHANTRCIKLRALPAPKAMDFNSTLTQTFVKCSKQLTVLELNGVSLDFKKMGIMNFPETLKRLVFHDCTAKAEQSIFCGIHTRLSQLEELGIEYCDWFEPYHIMILSKIPALRWLSLRGCSLFRDFIPYGSMAARFGFKKLEYLDLRFTPINDSDLQCFNAVATLKEMLLDCLQRPSPRPDAKEPSEDDCQPSTSRASNSQAEVPKQAESNEGSSEVSAAPNSNSNLSDNSQLNVTISLSSPFGRLAPCLDPPERASSSSSSSSSSSPSAWSMSSSTSSSSSSPSPPVSPRGLPPSRQAPDTNDNPEPVGNAPSRSRFLPRHDQVILLDVLNRQRPRQVRPNNGNGGDFDVMMNHPHFWNAINPQGVRRRCIAAVFEGVGPPESPRRPYRRYSISDRGICCFGRPQNPVEQGVIWIRIGNRPNENRFERLSVRNYTKVTDTSLKHLVQCSPDLVYLDLTGTSVTLEGVQRFKAQKPECHIVCEHLTELAGGDLR